MEDAAFVGVVTRGVGGVPTANVSDYRVIVVAASGLSVGPETEVRFDVDAFDGITDATAVTVYSRPQPGTGDFVMLSTDYNKSSNEIVATTSGFSEFVFGSNTNPLPVELTAFTATASGETVTLEWATASETNNAGFQVLRLLGELSAAGSEAGRHEPLGFVNGAYRLVAPFPNPSSGRAQMRLAVKTSQSVQVTVFDVLGRKCATPFDGPMAAGSEETVRLDRGLGPGLYLIRIDGDQFRATERLTIVQ